MNLIKISIIIPVYNAAPYIEKCIRSAMEQTLKEIEIIIINDGSTDESLTIIRKFERQDKRIIVIDGVNEGVSAARNKGLAVASGAYIGFADADDFAASTMYEALYHKAKETSADMVICNVYVVSENKDISVRLVLEDETLDIEMNRQKELVNLMHFKYDYANWNKIYSADIIKNNNLNFPRGLNMYEDLYFNLCFWQYAKKGIVLEDCLYNYRIHPFSVMNQAHFNLTSEYNKLFSLFGSVCNNIGWSNTLSIFQKEMGRGFYYTHISKIIAGVRSQRISIFRKIKLVVSQLKEVTPGLYSYSKDEMHGKQVLNKRLLKSKSFFLFSIIGLIRSK